MQTGDFIIELNDLKLTDEQAKHAVEMFAHGEGLGDRCQGCDLFGMSKDAHNLTTSRLCMVGQLLLGLWEKRQISHRRTNAERDTRSADEPRGDTSADKAAVWWKVIERENVAGLGRLEIRQQNNFLYHCCHLSKHLQSRIF